MEQINQDQFEQLVIEALDELPEEFYSKLDNVSVTVADLASPEQLSKVNQPHPFNLYGLYEGIPQPYRRHYTAVLPDKITIFRLPILHRYKSPQAIRHKIKSVVLHELGHHFGLGDDGLYQSKRAR